MKILLTGGAGFIGSNLLDRLILLNHDVVVIDNFDDFYDRNIKERNINEALKSNAITVFGDGESQRDYTFIDDIIQGIEKSITNLKGFNILNLGESQTISLAQLIKLIENALNKKAIIDRRPMQPGDVNKTYANIDKAISTIGYNPTTPISEGINKFVEWYKKQ